MIKLKRRVYFLLLLLLTGGASFSAFAHEDLPILLEDVNRDGIVNIQDLVRVATAFGVTRNGNPDPLAEDVNRDGIVNVLDLVRVSNSFGRTAPEESSAYHDLQEYIFDKSCANSVCHAAPANAGNLNLTYGLSYEDLVGVVPQNPAAAASGMKLVDPGNPENSFLLTKLMGPTAAEQGARMPFGGGVLHTGKIDAVRTWIEAGAPQTGKIVGIADLAVLRDPEEVFEPPAPPPPGEGYQLHLPPFKIEPGTEREVFYTTQITDENGNPVEEDIFLNRYEIFYPAGSHHFILYRLSDTAVAKGLLDAGVVPGIGVDPSDTFRVLDPTDAEQVLGHSGTDRFFIAGSQSDDFSFGFPEGVALRLPSDTIYDLNSHYINLLGTETLIGEVYINLYTLPPEEVKYEAVEIFVSNRNINVPPGFTRVTTMDWYIEDELTRQGIEPGTALNILMLTSHMHRHGELFEIMQKSTGDLLHRSVSYDGAPITLYNPPLVLEASDSIRFQCTHNNYDRDVALKFGFTSEDEMCLIVGYYYFPINAVLETN